MLLQDLPSHHGTRLHRLCPLDSAARLTQTEMDEPSPPSWDTACPAPWAADRSVLGSGWGFCFTSKGIFQTLSGSGIVSTCLVGPPCYGAGRVPGGPGTAQAGTGWELAHPEAALIQRNEAAQGLPPGARLGLEPRPLTPGLRSSSRSPGCSPLSFHPVPEYHEGI